MKNHKQIPKLPWIIGVSCPEFTFSTASRARDIAPFILAILPAPGPSCTYMYTQWPPIQRVARRAFPPDVVKRPKPNVHHLSRRGLRPPACFGLQQGTPSKYV